MGLLFSGCDDSVITGSAVTPPDRTLYSLYTDSTSIVTEIVVDDSVVADETSLNLAGTCVDPVFGKSEAGFYTQFVLSQAALVPDSGFKVDSIVLSLAFYGSYGDTSVKQTLDVYELSESISKDKNYLTTASFTLGNQLGTVSFTPKTHDSVKVAGVKQTPHLRIRLNNLEPKIQGITSSELASNEAFLNYFKGIYVQPVNTFTSGEGAIVYYNLYSATSKITVYYQKSHTDSLSYDFIINENCARINHFSHDYSGTPVATALQSTGGTGDSLLYLQSMAGTKVKLNFPFLKNYYDKGFVINKAELIIATDNSTDGDFYSPPARTYLINIGNGGENLSLKDGGEGVYNSAGKYYTLDISRHVQALFNGSLKNNGLFLFAGSNAVTANRGILRGGNHSKRMRLLLTYTKI